jgi:hypothetical protein
MHQLPWPPLRKKGALAHNTHLQRQAVPNNTKQTFQTSVQSIPLSLFVNEGVYTRIDFPGCVKLKC